MTEMFLQHQCEAWYGLKYFHTKIYKHHKVPQEYEYMTERKEQFWEFEKYETLLLSQSEDSGCYSDVVLFVDRVDQYGVKGSLPNNWG